MALPNPVCLEHVLLDPITQKPQGSICASLFLSLDGGKSDGRWRSLAVYKPTKRITTDGQHAKYTGFIESMPDRYFGIILSYKSKSGTVAKSWKTEDLLAYYYLDGRPHPVMEYSILSPGAKNPLPFSGLWSDNKTRFPLRWNSRSTISPNTPPENLFEPAASPALRNGAIFCSPLSNVDDLSSIRITIHKKDDLSHSGQLPRNQYPLKASDTDPSLFTGDRLSHSIGIEAPDLPADRYKSLFYTESELPSTLPLAEFRFWYKSRDLLERLSLASPRQIPDRKPHVSVPSSSTLQGSRSPEELPGSNDYAGVTSFDLPPPPLAPIAAPIATTSTPSRAVATFPASPAIDQGQSRPTPASAVSSPARKKVKVEDGPAPFSSLNPQPSPERPAPSSQSQNSASSRHPNVSASPSLTSTPVAALRQQANPPSTGTPANSSSLARFSAARDFLNEDRLDLGDDDDNIQALIDAGFKTKAKFLKTLPNCEPHVRDGILKGLQEQMGSLDYGVLLAYLKEECGI